MGDRSEGDMTGARAGDRAADGANGQSGASAGEGGHEHREIRDLRDVPPPRVHEEYDPAKHGERRSTPRGRR
jgi:hypothetical protein